MGQCYTNGARRGGGRFEMTSSSPGLQGLVLRFKSSYGLSETTARHHFIAARRFAGYLERAGLGVGDITPEVIAEYMHSDLSARLAESTARAYMVATRSFVYWLAEEGLVDREVTDGVRAIHYRTHKREVAPGAIDPELVRRFGLSCEGVNDRTRMDYESKVRSYSRYLESRRLDLESAGEGDVAAFAAKISEDYSVDSAFAVLTTVKRLYRWLEAEGIADDVARGVPAIKKKAKRLTEPLTPETARLVLEAAERQGNRERGLRDRAIVELMLVCALKPGELHDLDVGDVMTMGDHAVISVPSGPNRHASLAYVPKGTASLIGSYIGMRGAAGGEPLFATVGGRENAERRRLARSSIGSLVAKLFEKVGVEGRAASRGILRTSVEIAVSLGASEGELTRLGRFRTKVPCSNLESSMRDKAMLEDGIERVVERARPGSNVRITSVRSIRRAIEELGNEDLVAVEFPEGGGLEIRPVTRLGG